MKTLIIYATRYGTTGTCAQLLSDVLEGEVVLQNLAENPTIDLAGFETVVVGSPVYAGRINKRVKRFCSDHESTLLGKRLGLFTCDMEEGEGSIKQLDHCYAPTLVDHALVKNSFGGQFLFSHMGWFTKKMIKMMSKSDEDVKRIQYDAIKEFADVLNS
nr:flavodoxin domain-containing protein [uncultured Sphaerochaeta sp.]